MKIKINPDNLEIDDSWVKLRKVRAVVENDLGEIAICHEGEKCIFPGGKCHKSETNIKAIQRELKEEMGIDFNLKDLNKVFKLETFYKNYFNFRTNSFYSRHTITTYYYVKTTKKIDTHKMSLTENEKKKNFTISFVNKKDLSKMINKDHSNLPNGQFFDEENKIVLEQIVNKL